MSVVATSVNKTEAALSCFFRASLQTSQRGGEKSEGGRNGMERATEESGGGEWRRREGRRRTRMGFKKERKVVWTYDRIDTIYWLLLTDAM